MPKVTYVSPDGTEITLEGAQGQSVMDLAVKNGLRGIVAECGGALSCATCHVFVDENNRDLMGQYSQVEDEMLEGTAEERRENSRLSCQIKLEGSELKVHLPDSQI
jgi:2Fe-2S ferredoxin